MSFCIFATSEEAIKNLYVKAMVCRKEKMKSILHYIPIPTNGKVFWRNLIKTLGDIFDRSFSLSKARALSEIISADRAAKLPKNMPVRSF